MRGTPVPPNLAPRPSVPPPFPLSPRIPSAPPPLPHKDRDNDFSWHRNYPSIKMSSPENAPSPGYSPSRSSHPSQTTFSPSGIHHVLKQNSPSHAAPSQVPWDELPAGWVWPEQPVLRGKVGFQLLQTARQPSRAPALPGPGKKLPQPSVELTRMLSKDILLVIS